MRGTDESGAHDGYKERLVAATATATVRTSFVRSRNAGLQPYASVAQPRGRGAGAGAERPVIGRTELGGQKVEIPRFSNFVPMRATTGDPDEMPLLAGQGIGLVDRVTSAASVIDAITAQAVAMLGRYRP
ncbi:hypothetical protein M1L60_25520 [Actinoplanes sp. TRM 88003]|uniref:Nitronate monooxygenase n=1 Tax=Paractinoplanes aksuensis TaxID=2939490 RepID=A0ABT1DSY6_9ACTN|nr:hypothetical protein [Actinoplanes aksuensis]MCO8273963.1 hypothetical protein [Actinoplanes aksuensis]